MRIKINKLDVARRQLCAAVNLYFKEYDMVAIHTIVHASFQITKNLCAKTNNKTYLEELFKRYVAPGKEKEAFNAINRTGNFLKHADKDPLAEHGYNSQETETLLMLSIWQYSQLSEESIVEFKIYSLWYQIHHPDFYILPPNGVGILSKVVADYGNNKSGFYRDAYIALNGMA